MARITPDQAKKKFVDNTKVRFYKILDYLSLFIYILLVSGAALIADFILIQLLEFTVADDIAQNEVVSLFFSWYKIGSAFLVFIGAIVHSVFSVASQVKFEIESFR